MSLPEKVKLIDNLKGPLQHLTFSSLDVESFQEFYSKKLGFKITDTVVHKDGKLATSFITSNHEHHTLACFKSKKMELITILMRLGIGIILKIGATISQIMTLS